MKIRLGYELIYQCPKPTPMILCLNIHYSRISDLLLADHIRTDPAVPLRGYRDSFGNWRSRLLAPPGQIKISTDAIINDSGQADAIDRFAQQHPVESLPSDTLEFLQGSRYCETDRLSDTAWALFGTTTPGWPRVQAICDYVHQHIQFGYQYARLTKTALAALDERNGVCRDYAHLAITFCRCMNIPARYCSGYLGDIGIPAAPYPMDFSAWFEAYIGGRWTTFDPRNNTPRIGHILIARGRDAADVPISNVFGPNQLKSFKVWTDEIVDQ